VSDDRFEPPPPPPPDLAPPPGYAAYSGRPNRVRTIVTFRNIILGLLVLIALSGIYQLFQIPGLVDKSKDFLAGRIDADTYRDETGSAVAAIQALPSLACIVLSILWLHNLMRAHVELGRRGTWGPGWAIGGWFLPPLVLYVIPMLVLGETWKAADPSVPLGDDSWRRGRVHPVLWVWWLLYGIAPLVFLVAGLRQQFGNLGADEEDIAKSFVDNSGTLYGQAIVTLLAAGAWAGVVYLWTARHQRLVEMVAVAG
jgi:hypothetical protein